MIIGIDASRANRSLKTGVEWYAHDLIEALKKIIPADISVVLYSDAPLIGSLAALPMHWHSKVLRWPPKRFWTIVRFSYELLRHPPDVLFVPASALPFWLPKRTVTTIHDVGFDRLPQAYRWRSRWYLRFNVWRALRRCTRILAISEFTKQEITSLYGTPGERITVTLLAAHHLADEETVAQNHPAHPYVFYVGRYELKKNVDMMIRGFARFRINDTLRHTLVLAGARGWGAEAIDAVIREVGALRIVVLPWVSETERSMLLKAAAVFLFPTRYEGFGMPVLEAMDVGVPVITSQAGGAAEVAGSAALLVDCNSEAAISDALVSITTDAKVRQRLVEAGKSRAAQFTWAQTAETTWQALQTTMERNP